MLAMTVAWGQRLVDEVTAVARGVPAEEVVTVQRVATRCDGGQMHLGMGMSRRGRTVSPLEAGGVAW